MKGIGNIVSAVLVIVLIFVSGCVGGAKAESTGGVNGLSVTSLKATGGTKGDTVAINLNVENRGTVTANNSCIEISGYDWLVKQDPVTKAQLSGSTAWFGVGTVRDATGNVVGDDHCSNGGLMEPRRGTTPAQAEFVSWDFDTSTVLNPIKDKETFTPVVKVWSKYATVSTFDLRVMNSDEYNRFVNTKGNSLGTINYDVTEGPVSVQIKGTSPIRISQGSVPFEIVIANTGGKNTDVFDPAKATGRNGYVSLTKNDYERVKLEALDMPRGTVVCNNGNVRVGQTVRLTANEDTGRLETTLRCRYTPTDTNVRDVTLTGRIQITYGYSVKYDTPLVLTQNIDIDAGSRGTQSNSNPQPVGSGDSGSSGGTTPGQTPGGVSSPDEVLGG